MKVFFWQDFYISVLTEVAICSFLKNLLKFTGKDPYRNLFLIKLQNLQLYLKKRLRRRSFLANFRNTFFHRTPPGDYFLTFQYTVHIYLTLLFIKRRRTIFHSSKKIRGGIPIHITTQSIILTFYCQATHPPLNLDDI